MFGHEQPGVLVLRVVQHGPRRALLHHLAPPHDQDLVAQLGDDGQVVGDDDERQAGALAQFGEQVEDLGLDRDVECGGGLVGDEGRGSTAIAAAIRTRWSMPPDSS